jgi:hypothetical protein
MGALWKVIIPNAWVTPLIRTVLSLPAPEMMLVAGTATRKWELAKPLEKIPAGTHRDIVEQTGNQSESMKSVESMREETWGTMVESFRLTIQHAWRTYKQC